MHEPFEGGWHETHTYLYFRPVPHCASFELQDLCFSGPGEIVQTHYGACACRVEKEEEKKKQAAEAKAKADEAEREKLINDNPMLRKELGIEDEPTFQVKRRWDDDVVFKNQAATEPKRAKRFINDTVRSDFHKRFLDRYVK